MGAIGPWAEYERLGGGGSSTPSHYDKWSAELERENARAMREDHRLPSPFRPGSVPWLVSNGARAVWFIAKRFWCTLLWILAIALLGSFVMVLAALMVVGWLVCFAVLQSGVDHPAIRAVLFSAPVLGDIRRLSMASRRRRDLSEGNALLREMQMVPPSDERVYDAHMDYEAGIFSFDVPLSGATEEAVRDKVAAGLPVVGAADVELHRMGNSRWEAHFYPEVRKTALDEPREISTPPDVDFSKMSVGCFFSETGRTEYLSLSGTSGTLVGGLPGGGKTAFITAFLAPLIVDDRVNVTVCDGKGGMDFDSVSDYVDCFFNDDTDFDSIISLLEAKEDLMRERIRTGKDLTGASNFWDTPITSERPVELIVIDEAQNWLEKTGAPKGVKPKMERIEALVKSLIKKGRSAGIHIFISSQKPDANTISTSIRDLCGRRVCFSVTTPEMATMILGATSEDAPSPTDIPADRIGGCVIASDSGQLVQARALYYPEKKLEAYLAKNSTPKADNRWCVEADDGEVE